MYCTMYNVYSTYARLTALKEDFEVFTVHLTTAENFYIFNLLLQNLL